MNNVDDVEELSGEVIDISTWKHKLNQLAAEGSDTQIQLPKALAGRRVDRQEVANAFLTSFELVGGVPRLALYADSHYDEFIKIFGRLMPKETLTVHDGEIVIKHAIAPSALDDETGERR